MGSLKDPKTWIPHINPKDCSKKVCNIYCTKWCKFVILPSPPPRPPPPPPLVKDSLGGSFVSPVVIVIVALIGTLLILIGYYVIISRYCSRNNGSSSMLERRVVENQETHDDHEAVGVHGHDHVDDHAIYVPWLVLGKGLDEALIKSITICKYKRGDGLVSCTDCSVCLGEFQENESLRLLPNCCHAFHVSCIDTWFKTHSNCPLCRANVCFEVTKDSSLISPSTLTPPPPPPPPMTNESSGRDVTLEIIRDEGERKITRSKSMDHYLCQTRVSTPQVMFFDQAKNMVQEEVGFQDAGSSRNVSKGNNIGLNIVNVSHFGVKRSFSSGRYSFTRDCV